MNKKKIYPWWFLIIPLALYVIFFLLPSAMGVGYSFTDWNSRSVLNGTHFIGLENFKDREGYYVFHAGSKFDEQGRVVTNGGRVLGVTATGTNLKEARANAYKATEWIDFDNKYMRHDIGHAIDEA